MDQEKCKDCSKSAGGYKMRKRYYEPYGIKINYEYKTYKYVGRDYGDSKDANLGWVFNLARFLRKKRNKQQIRYAFCNTYTEWTSHIQGIVRKDIANGNDLLHWIYDKRNVEKQWLEAIKTILIPIYLVLLSVLDFFVEIPKEYAVWIFVAAILIVILPSMVYLYGAINKVNFYNDFIEIIEKIIENNRCEQG